MDSTKYTFLNVINKLVLFNSQRAIFFGRVMFARHTICVKLKGKKKAGSADASFPSVLESQTVESTKQLLFPTTDALATVWMDSARTGKSLYYRQCYGS